jgi:hypothetical protein
MVVRIQDPILYESKRDRINTVNDIEYSYSDSSCSSVFKISLYRLRVSTDKGETGCFGNGFNLSASFGRHIRDYELNFYWVIAHYPSDLVQVKPSGYYG